MEIIIILLGVCFVIGIIATLVYEYNENYFSGKKYNREEPKYRIAHLNNGEFKVEKRHFKHFGFVEHYVEITSYSLGNFKTEEESIRFIKMRKDRYEKQKEEEYVEMVSSYSSPLTSREARKMKLKTIIK